MRTYARPLNVALRTGIAATAALGLSTGAAPAADPAPARAKVLVEMVRQITGARMISLHTDMSTSTGERIVVLIVDTNLHNPG